jgi:hypothetical protein
MNGETNERVTTTRASPIENLAKEIDPFRTIVSAVVAVLVVAFTAGVLAQKIATYEAIVDRQREQIDQIKDDLKNVKRNLGDLFEPSYQIEAGNDTRCETGNVVTGLRIDLNQKIWVRCASLGRAVWNPAPATK